MPVPSAPPDKQQPERHYRDSTESPKVGEPSPFPEHTRIPISEALVIVILLLCLAGGPLGTRSRPP